MHTQTPHTRVLLNQYIRCAVEHRQRMHRSTTVIAFVKLGRLEFQGFYVGIWVRCRARSAGQILTD